MPAIVSPLPRPASCYRDSASMQLVPSSSCPFPDSYPDTTASRRVTGIPMLMSPINLAESRPGAPLFKPQSPPPCTSARRRRGPTIRISRRRRHCTRTDCRFDTFGAAIAFDRLPWISAMESTSDQLNTWDMADLSQLPAEEFPADVSDASGPGPVRRRKTSLRTNPLASGPEPSDASPLRLRMQALDVAHMPSSPHTPTSQTFNPYEVDFQDLLPVFPSRDSLNDESRY